jgi:hypothetical protein
MVRRDIAKWRDRMPLLLDRWLPSRGRPILAFLGDSHVDYFSHAARRGYFGRRRYGACAIAGATAVGLRNPNGKTNAVAILTGYLTGLRPDAIVVVQMGEVDCGFVIWYRAEKYGDGIDRQMEESVAGYFSFVDHAIARGYRHVVVTGATLPTIADDQNWGEVANLRREVRATLAERTALTLRYNARLAEQASRRSLPFVDIAAELLDPQTGVVRREFLNPDPLNHHLDKERAALSWARALSPLLGAFD